MTFIYVVAFYKAMNFCTFQLFGGKAPKLSMSHASSYFTLGSSLPFRLCSPFPAPGCLLIAFWQRDKQTFPLFCRWLSSLFTVLFTRRKLKELTRFYTQLQELSSAVSVLIRHNYMLDSALIIEVCLFSLLLSFFFSFQSFCLSHFRAD
jgi:hypothetical protein